MEARSNRIIAEFNKLIAEFMGYKLLPCNNGKAWESPHQKAVDDIFKIHGRLWKKDDPFYKWDSSWDWLIPVIEKIESRGFPTTIWIEGVSIESAETGKNISLQNLETCHELP
jgi:hypothetical protein